MTLLNLNIESSFKIPNLADIIIHTVDGKKSITIIPFTDTNLPQELSENLLNVNDNTENNKNNFENIKDKRVLKQLIRQKFDTMGDCAAAMDINRSTLSKLINDPSRKFLKRLKAVGVEINGLE